MLRTVLETLEAQLQQQRTVLESLRAVCLEQEREIAMKVEHIESLKRVFDEMDIDSQTSPGPRRQKKKRTLTADESGSAAQRIRETSRAILREAGRPMTQRAIKQKMDEMGFSIDSEKPVELIRIYLNRAKDEFSRVGTEGYIALG
jgi:uncharacterized coiled-coil protein SlyX